MSTFTKFLRDDDGTTAVEYAVMLGLIIVTALTAIAALGQQGGSMFGGIKNEMDAHGIN